MTRTNERRDAEPEPEPNRTLGVRIATAVAEAKGVAPAELSPPLARVVDPDALAAVVRGGSETCASFDYAGYRVVVEGPDPLCVRVEGPNEGAAGDDSLGVGSGPGGGIEVD